MECLNRDHRAVTRRRVLSTAFLAAALAAPLIESGPGRADSIRDAQSSQSTGPLFACGYDPSGATDEWSNHKQNLLRLARQSVSSASAARTRSFGPSSQDAGDIALVEDDGTIVTAPTRFNLKNSSLLFTPDADGYRISVADVPFIRDFGYKIGFFFGGDNRPGHADDGYCYVRLIGNSFPFYGVYYDTIYIGTNGYITFTQGDASARISPTSLASELPRIAPLWADLELETGGELYYNRLDGRHIVTWSGAGQPSYSGSSSFQAVLYDDGRIAFVYRKVKAQSALVGISPGHSETEPQPIDFSSPPAEGVTGAFFQIFGKQKRIDLPALLKAFYRTHSDSFDTAYVWTDFDYDNGLGVAHSFNVRNAISGIGLTFFDRGVAYGSPATLSTIITMGNENAWPSDPQTHAAGLNSAISIVCHEQGHRWLAYVRFDAEHDIKDDLLGRENAHWSFLVDTRTNAEGSFSSLMEGNAWRDAGGGVFTTVESAVNYFTPLDQYLMGLRAADEVGEITYLVTTNQVKDLIREKSPVSGFSMSATRKTTSVAQIVEREGPRIPDAANAPKETRIAFIVLTEQGRTPSSATLDKVARYRDSLVNYFSIATGGRGSLNASLN